MEIFKIKKIFFFQIFLTLYIVINLIGGERGLISFFKKDNYEKKLFIKHTELKHKLEFTEHRNRLLSDIPDTDFLDTVYRSKLKFGTKSEVLIKHKQ